jgi:hypothetical protein
MRLNIKNREAHLMAEELSKLTGESMTTAVTIALRERLARQTRITSMIVDTSALAEFRRVLCLCARKVHR